MHAFRAAMDKGDLIYAIPCPTHRETKSWALDAVPLVPRIDPAGASLRAAGGATAISRRACGCITRSAGASHRVPSQRNLRLGHKMGNRTPQHPEIFIE